jgi:hypothetical protein
MKSEQGQGEEEFEDVLGSKWDYVCWADIRVCKNYEDELKKDFE